MLEESPESCTVLSYLFDEMEYKFNLPFCEMCSLIDNLQIYANVNFVLRLGTITLVELWPHLLYPLFGKFNFDNTDLDCKYPGDEHANVKR